MHGTILHNSMYRFDDQTAAFGLPAEDDGSRDDALLCLNMPSCPAHRRAGRRRRNAAHGPHRLMASSR
jgi:hypothetical protein